MIKISNMWHMTYYKKEHASMTALNYLSTLHEQSLTLNTMAPFSYLKENLPLSHSQHLT